MKEKQQTKPTIEMTYKFDNPPTREAMIEELGVNPDRLVLAENSIRDRAKSEDEMDWEKDKYSEGEVAYLLTRWGIAEAFALFCLRTGRSEGGIEVISSGEGRVYSVRADFDQTGRLKMMKAKARDCDPFQGMRAEDAKSEAWRELQRAKIEKATDETVSCGDDCDGRCPLVTVIRFPLSRTQAYRKFLAERWYDPDVPCLDRFACPLDRARFNSFLDSTDAMDRFEEAIAKLDGETKKG